MGTTAKIWKRCPRDIIKSCENSNDKLNPHELEIFMRSHEVRKKIASEPTIISNPHFQWFNPMRYFMQFYNIPQKCTKSHEIPMKSSSNHQIPRYRSDKSPEFPTNPSRWRRHWTSTNSWRKPCGRSPGRHKRRRPRLRSLGRRGGWTNGINVMEIYWRYHGISIFEIIFYKWRISIDGWRNWINVMNMFWGYHG